ncbi:MAG: AraC family transcriptional regulator [Terrimicrobiaceae bacterium]
MLSYFAHVLQDLKLDPAYDGFLFLAESARNPPSLRSHHHAELELNIVARGTVTYVAGGQRLSFGRRSLLWMFPAQEHQLVDRTNDAQYYVAVFKPDLIARSCHAGVYKGLTRKKSEGGKVPHTVLDPETFGFLRRMMDHVMEGSIDPDILNREAGFGVGPDFRYRHNDPDGLNAGLHHLLLLCWRLQQTGTARQRSVPLHPSVSKAIELLGDDSWEGSLGRLAKECGLSGAHFSRMFARQVGVPLNRYRNSLRLARFWEHHRRHPAPTILEAVYAAGFGSYAQFFKVFSDAYGEGPRACLQNRQAAPADRTRRA